MRNNRPKGDKESGSSYNKRPPQGGGNPGDMVFGKRHKTCPFVAAGIRCVDYKDTDTLNQFITERGKIIPRRVSGVSMRFQRLLTKAIKQARYMALLPFVAQD